MLYLEFLFLLVMLYIGSRYGGIGLGVVSGIGLVIEVFIFKMPPTSSCHRYVDHPSGCNMCIDS